MLSCVVILCHVGVRYIITLSYRMISCSRDVEMDPTGRLICLFKSRGNVLNVGLGKLWRKLSKRTYLQGVCCIQRHRYNIMFMCSYAGKHTQKPKENSDVLCLKLTSAIML